MTRDNKPNDERGPPQRRASDRCGSVPRRQRGYVQRAIAGGHSGHGSDSVLPHLRDQLKLKALLPSKHPVPELLRPGKDEHHW
ncbi:MAG: hypothetical protein JWP65_1920 [Ramlibacter sp.]|jgi:hypothetical protein|uniref:hypothetical protein n=1 Tax=Ramlibacter sp. TaxID=1917967 RepID=UPI00262860FA|nr:hypothetical protein [Ramlibacter sp.]MDB5751499.1 hypothetical protein [Ramlibacter sp.]